MWGELYSYLGGLRKQVGGYRLDGQGNYYQADYKLKTFIINELKRMIELFKNNTSLSRRVEIKGKWISFSGRGHIGDIKINDRFEIVYGNFVKGWVVIDLKTINDGLNSLIIKDHTISLANLQFIFASYPDAVHFGDYLKKILIFLEVQKKKFSPKHIGKNWWFGDWSWEEGRINSNNSNKISYNNSCEKTPNKKDMETGIAFLEKLLQSIDDDDRSQSTITQVLKERREVYYSQ